MREPKGNRRSISDARIEAAELRHFQFLEHFSDADLAVLASEGEAEQVTAGQTVFQERDPSADLYLVLQGTVEGHRSSVVGPQPVMRLRVGHLLGESGFLDGQGRECTATMTQDGRLLRFPVARLQRRLKLSPELAVAMWRVFWHSLTLKVRQANGFMSEIAATSRLVPEKGNRATGQAVILQPSDKADVFSRQGISAAELRLLMMTLPAERFPGEEVIFFEGDAADGMFVVADGRVRISRRLPGMGEEAVAFVERGEVFGEMAIIDDALRSADARAHQGPCTVLRVTRRDLDEILAMPEPAAEFLALLCRLLVRRLRSMIEMLVSWRVMTGPPEG